MEIERPEVNVECGPSETDNVSVEMKKGILKLIVNGKVVPSTDIYYDEYLDILSENMGDMLGDLIPSGFLDGINYSLGKSLNPVHEGHEKEIQILPKKVRSSEPIVYTNGYGYDEVGPKDNHIELQDNIDNSIAKTVNTIRHEYALATDVEYPEYEHDINKLTQIRELIQDLYNLDEVY